MTNAIKRNFINSFQSQRRKRGRKRADGDQSGEGVGKDKSHWCVTLCTRKSGSIKWYLHTPLSSWALGWLSQLLSEIGKMLVAWIILSTWQDLEHAVLWGCFQTGLTEEEQPIWKKLNETCNHPRAKWELAFLAHIPVANFSSSKYSRTGSQQSLLPLGGNRRNQ